MRKIGGHVSSAGGPINAVKNTLEISGNCMQIFAGSPRMWRRSLYEEKQCKAFKKEVKSKNLNPVFIHALYLANLASDKKELREKTKKALIKDMKNSACIDAKGVVVHIGSHQGRGFEQVKDIVVSEIQEILSQTPKNSKLLLENIAGQKGKVGSIKEIGILLKEINSQRLKVCLDTAHAFQAGHAIHKKQGLKDFLQLVKKHIGLENVLALHLNDSKTRLGSAHDIHENIGEGYIGKSGLKEIINHKDLKSIPLILEVPGFAGNGPDEENIKIVKSLVE